MAQIITNFNNFENTIKNFESNYTDIKNEFNKIKNEYENMQYDSPTAIKLRNKFESETVADFENCCRDMENYIASLEYALTNYNKADNESL